MNDPLQKRFLRKKRRLGFLVPEWLAAWAGVVPAPARGLKRLDWSALPPLDESLHDPGARFKLGGGA